MGKITVNGHEIDWNDNMTVRNVLDRMKYSFRMLVIKVNGTIVKREDWETFPVPEGADVKVIHLMSGG
ncbi:MAG: sulfur carrier protein ThiS [Candidatus Delongbacteria bacterium]|nr:sulfur carrier protein ThiS [Candidatus Delongbacteria bacterium]